MVSFWILTIDNLNSNNTNNRKTDMIVKVLLTVMMVQNPTQVRKSLAQLDLSTCEAKVRSVVYATFGC